MDDLQASWSAFDERRSRAFLKTEDAPAEGSKQLLADVLARLRSGGRDVSVLDLGCGNGQLLEALRASGVAGRYLGVDFSDALLEAAREAYGGLAGVGFVAADVSTLAGVDSGFDVAVFSHTVEMLSAPEDALRAARERAQRIAIRFFEPPEFDSDSVELRHLDVGAGRKVPYLRRKMSRDYYRLILHRIGCRRVDVYQDDGSKDQVHLLHF